MSGIDPNAKKITNNLARAGRDHSNSIEKLSSGKVFTSQNPRPADRAIAERLEYKLRGLAASKRNINDAISLVQTAESGFTELSNIITRMKEINVAAATTTTTNRERRFLFIEYEALRDEVDRIATTTEFNNIPILNASSDKAPSSLILRVADPFISDLATSSSGDINEIRFENYSEIVATANGLGVRSAFDLIEDEEGVSVEAARELMESEEDNFTTIYDEALDRLTEYRTSFGAMQSRIQRALDVNEVIEENIAAAKSKIEDTDYAAEIAKMTQSAILLQANSALLTQTNFRAGLGLNLINAMTS